MIVNLLFYISRAITVNLLIYFKYRLTPLKKPRSVVPLCFVEASNVLAGLFQHIRLLGSLQNTILLPCACVHA